MKLMHILEMNPGIPDQADQEHALVLDYCYNNLSVTDACVDYLGMSEEDAQDADGTYFDDVAEAICTDPEFAEEKARILDIMRQQG